MTPWHPDYDVCRKVKHNTETERIIVQLMTELTNPLPARRNKAVNAYCRALRISPHYTRRSMTSSELSSTPSLGLYFRGSFSWLYPLSERSETGGYTVFTFVSLSVCLCVSVRTQSSLQHLADICTLWAPSSFFLFLSTGQEIGWEERPQDDLFASSKTLKLSSISLNYQRRPVFSSSSATGSCGRRFKMHRRSLSAEPEACSGKAGLPGGQASTTRLPLAHRRFTVGSTHRPTRLPDTVLPRCSACIGTSWPVTTVMSPTSRNCFVLRHILAVELLKIRIPNIETNNPRKHKTETHVGISLPLFFCAFVYDSGISISGRIISLAQFRENWKSFLVTFV